MWNIASLKLHLMHSNIFIAEVTNVIVLFWVDKKNRKNTTSKFSMSESIFFAEAKNQTWPDNFSAQRKEKSTRFFIFMRFIKEVISNKLYLTFCSHNWYIRKLKIWKFICPYVFATDLMTLISHPQNLLGSWNFHPLQLLATRHCVITYISYLHSLKCF